ncbi:MAG TPA: DNA repair and recombination protein RadA [Nitrososphaeraceae archaeon]|nr:DNA repair and recombination protein RadA [Nitrososphaeraceae archaeon]
MTLEEIPNITSDMIEKLRKLNIESVYQLAVQSPFELSSRYEDTSLDFNSASVIIANARKILTEHEVLGKEFSTADQVLDKRNNIIRYATGSDKFDSFLNGGFESQSITELVGEFGSGKSQICHTLCIAANKLMEISPHNDAEKSNKHSTSGNIIFIDTENTFRAERAYQIAEQKGLDPLTVLNTIYHCNVFNSEELESIIDNLDKFIEQYNAKLVIIDSIISLHRAEFSGRGTLAERQQRLGKTLNKLRRIADIYNIAVVITNQVVSYADSSHPGFDYMKAAGGNIVAHGSTYRIFLRKSGKNRIATIEDSPYQPYQRMKFYISENGIQDAISYKTQEESDSSW